MIRTKPTLILLILVFSLSGLKLSIAQQSSKCIAIIIEISGDVLVKETGKTVFIKALWGTQLFQGDQIKTSDKSLASLLFANSSLIKLDANSMLTISINESATSQSREMSRNISAAMMGNFSALAFRRDEKEEKGWMTGLRSGNEDQTIKLEFPYNTLIKTNHPAFSWITDKSFESYKVNLYNSKGLVWSKKVSESSINYPENEKELEFGESYFWSVEGEDLIDNVKSANHGFSVLSIEKSREIEKQETIIRNTFRDEPESSSLHSVLGAYFIEQGLLQDAINEFQNISKMNIEAPLPHEILGSIYLDAGDKDKAIEELQRALELSKNKDK
jgi:tetratricopeptide (TPR) repeat protein